VDSEQRTGRRRRRDLVRRRRARLAAGALAAFVLGAVVGAIGGGDDAPEPVRPATSEQQSPAGKAPVVDRLTLSQQVGHMVILRFAGTSAPGYVRRVLREGRAAGAILFRDNVVSPAQLRALTGALRTASKDVLICVDQEGGEVRIVPWAGPELPAPEQAAAGTVRDDAAAAGRELRAAGVNVTLAPVADVPSVEGSALAGRSFSGDPDQAAGDVSESVAGWHDAGVATTAKHFPGLGGATVNTDEGPATVNLSRAEIDADLAPFRAAVDAGTEFVMASHATYPAIDDAHIASQSPAVIGGLLRDELGFDGVVMTDSLEAAAVRAVSGVEEAAVASARAGVDVILTTGRGSYIRVYRALLARARADPDFRRRVHESAARVLEAQSSGNG
jgi:beta-N-acetylhexosaminidase